MAWNDHSLLMKKALYVWHIVREMGYPAEHIFFRTSRQGDLSEVFITVDLTEFGFKWFRPNEVQRTFDVRIDTSPEPRTVLADGWKQIALEWSNGTISDDELVDLHRTLGMTAAVVQLLTSLRYYGLPTSPEMFSVADSIAPS